MYLIAMQTAQLLYIGNHAFKQILICLDLHKR